MTSKSDPSLYPQFATETPPQYAERLRRATLEQIESLHDDLTADGQQGLVKHVMSAAPHPVLGSLLLRTIHDFVDELQRRQEFSAGEFSRAFLVPGDGKVN
jgi:hypothetical protein